MAEEAPRSASTNAGQYVEPEQGVGYELLSKTHVFNSTRKLLAHCGSKRTTTLLQHVVAVVDGDGGWGPTSLPQRLKPRKETNHPTNQSSNNKRKPRPPPPTPLSH